MSRPGFQKHIEKRIASLPEGSAFITSDFLDIADTQVVNKALSRIAEAGSIRRILRGVYDRSRYSELLQEWAAPKMEEVAKAIARNFGWTIRSLRRHGTESAGAVHPGPSGVVLHQ